MILIYDQDLKSLLNLGDHLVNTVISYIFFSIFAFINSIFYTIFNFIDNSKY
jgi:hypothetical protein